MFTTPGFFSPWFLATVLCHWKQSTPLYKGLLKKQFYKSQIGAEISLAEEKTCELQKQTKQNQLTTNLKTPISWKIASEKNLKS